jgi:hypothetical protein
VNVREEDASCRIFCLVGLCDIRIMNDILWTRKRTCVTVLVWVGRNTLHFPLSGTVELLISYCKYSAFTLRKYSHKHILLRVQETWKLRPVPRMRTVFYAFFVGPCCLISDDLEVVVAVMYSNLSMRRDSSNLKPVGWFIVFYEKLFHDFQEWGEMFHLQWVNDFVADVSHASSHMGVD